MGCQECEGRDMKEEATHALKQFQAEIQQFSGRLKLLEEARTPTQVPLDDVFEPEATRRVTQQVQDYVRGCEPGTLEIDIYQLLVQAKALIQRPCRMSSSMHTESGDGRVANCESLLESCGNVLPGITGALEGLRLWENYVPQRDITGGDTSKSRQVRHATFVLLERCIQKMSQIQQTFLNFNQHILPETIRAALARDSSVLAAFDELRALREDVANWWKTLSDLNDMRSKAREFEQNYESELQKAKSGLANLNRSHEDEMGWEEADERAERLDQAEARLQDMQQRWRSRQATKEALAQQRAQRKADLETLQFRFSRLIDVESAFEGGKILIAGFAQLWRPLEESHSELCSLLSTLQAEVQSEHLSDHFSSIGEAFTHKIDTFQRVFFSSLVLSTPKHGQEVSKAGGSQGDSVRPVFVAEQLSRDLCECMTSYCERIVAPIAVAALTTCCSVLALKDPVGAHIRSSGTGCSQSPDELFDSSAGPLSSSCSMALYRALQRRKAASLAASRARLEFQLSYSKQSLRETIWLRGDGLADTEAGAAERYRLLSRMQEALTQVYSLQHKLGMSRARHAEVLNLFLQRLEPRSGPTHSWSDAVSSGGAQNTIARSKLYDELSALYSAGEGRISSLMHVLQQTAGLAQALLRLERTRSGGITDERSALQQENCALLRCAADDAQLEAQLAVQVEHLQSICTSLHAAVAAGAEAAAQHVNDLHISSKQMHGIATECRIVEAQVQGASDELSRLFSDGVGMSDDALSVIEQLEKLAVGRSGFETILEIASHLRSSWRDFHDQAAIMSSLVVPHTLRFRSSREHICSLLASSDAWPRDSNAGGVDVSLFVNLIGQQAQALYPLLLQLGMACATMSTAMADKSADSKDDDGGDAESTADVSEYAKLSRNADAGTAMEGEGDGPDASTAVGRGTKQQKNTYALTVLRRVKCKLDGKDRWPGKERDTKQSVAEHVETVIKLACSIDNLSQLYEGWAAWI